MLVTLMMFLGTQKGDHGLSELQQPLLANENENKMEILKRTWNETVKTVAAIAAAEAYQFIIIASGSSCQHVNLATVMQFACR